MRDATGAFDGSVLRAMGDGGGCGAALAYAHRLRGGVFADLDLLCLQKIQLLILVPLNVHYELLTSGYIITDFTVRQLLLAKCQTLSLFSLLHLVVVLMQLLQIRLMKS